MKKIACFAGLLTLTSTLIADWEEVTSNLTVDIRPLSSPVERATSDGTRIYITTLDGVYVSSDNGSNFTELNAISGSALEISGFDMRGITFENGFVWLNTAGGGVTSGALFRLAPGDTSWTLAGGGIPINTTGSVTDDISYDSSTSTYYALSSSNIASFPTSGSLWTSSDGLSWTQKNNFVGGIAGLPSSIAAFGGEIYVLRPQGLFRSTDGGTTFAAITDAIGAFDVSGDMVESNGAVIIGRASNPPNREVARISNGGTVINASTVPNGGNNFEVGNGIVTASGGNLAAFNLTGGNIGMWFSANDGLSWEGLDDTGLEVTGVAQRVDYLFMSDTHIFAISSRSSDNTDYRLWRRSLSEFDLRAATAVITPPEGGQFTVGQSTTLTVQAVGEGTLTYQWKLDGVDIPGATSDTLSLADLQLSSAGNYTVVVTGDKNSAESDPATVEILVTLAGLVDTGFVNGRSQASWGKAYIAPNGNIVQVDYFSVNVFNESGTLLNRNQSIITDNIFDIRQGLVDENGDILVRRDLGLIKLDGDTLNKVTGWPFETFTRGNDATGTAVLRDIAEIPGTGYLIAADKDLVADGTTFDSVFVINYDGTINTNFNFFDNSNNLISYELCEVGPNGEIYIGNFGSDAVRVTATGALAATLDVNSLELMLAANDGGLITVDSADIPEKWNADGTKITSFNVSETGFAGTVFDLAQEANGKIVFAGDITRFGSSPVIPGYARLNADGTFDSDFNTPLGFETVSFGIIFNAKDMGGVTYDPRGSYYVTPVLTDNAQFQRTGRTGMARMYADALASTGSTFADFAEANFPVGQRGPDDDGNGNGITNFEEYIYVIDDGDFGKLPSGSLKTAADLGVATGSPTDTYLSLEVRIRKDATNLNIVSKAATDLANIASGQSNTIQVGTPVDQGDVLIYTFRTTFTVEDESKGFIIVEVEESN
ncbi:MAG: hypothetical protein AAGH40_05680 [Verrucomicrobiota bacterium]